MLQPDGGNGDAVQVDTHVVRRGAPLDPAALTCGRWASVDVKPPRTGRSPTSNNGQAPIGPEVHHVEGRSGHLRVRAVEHRGGHRHRRVHQGGQHPIHGPYRVRWAAADPSAGAVGRNGGCCRSADTSGSAAGSRYAGLDLADPVCASSVATVEAPAHHSRRKAPVQPGKASLVDDHLTEQFLLPHQSPDVAPETHPASPRSIVPVSRGSPSRGKSDEARAPGRPWCTATGLRRSTQAPGNSQPSVPSPMSSTMTSSMKWSSNSSSVSSPASQSSSISSQLPRLPSMRRGAASGCRASRSSSPVLTTPLISYWPLRDVVGDRVGGDDGDVLVRGVDDVAVAAADVVLGVGQPLEQSLGRHVESGVLQGLLPAVGRGELAELGVPVLGVVGRQPVAGGDLGAQEVVEGGAQGSAARRWGRPSVVTFGDDLAAAR